MVPFTFQLPLGLCAGEPPELRGIPRDQVRLLRTDKVIGGSEPLLGDLGVRPQALETIVPEYLSVYRR